MHQSRHAPVYTLKLCLQLLKVAKHIPGQSQIEIDQDAVLIRAYGNQTHILIDRDRDTTTHALCAKHGLAPALLARFKNGVLYRYIAGRVCTPEDLVGEPVWRAVARHLGEWHAKLPIDSVVEVHHRSDLPSKSTVPSIWSVMQKWINALPCDSSKQKNQRELLQIEYDRSFRDLNRKCGPGSDGLVFGHCDLVSSNVIILPEDAPDTTANGEVKVSFIDYEYATLCPAAFDIANHFAEWGGYDCDYTKMPTRSVRRQFLQEYLESYKVHCGTPVSGDMLDVLFEEVDRYRGIPGFYGALWSLIQTTISHVDFDYSSLAEARLGEYYAWRGEEDGSRAKEGKEMSLRERRWAES